jgi:predicted AAA+ superfamily ATPase
MTLDLPVRQSAFLWGARSTGKSTFLKQQFPKSLYYDLLNTDVLNKLRIRPAILREELSVQPPEVLQYPIIIDEVQKIPQLLDEIHWLIENKSLSFILCGSSARKLKRGAANLLGGRAWKFTFYPLTFSEIGDFDLLRALNQGLIPSIYQSKHYKRAFTAYVDLYLKEEIQAEGLVRNLPGFARFLDLVGFSNTEPLNYKKIATDCGVDAKTVKEYYNILLDTLIGYYVYPFSKNEKRQVISSTPKFYLFDVGVGCYLSKKPVLELRGSAAGSAFEHYILMELTAYIGLKELGHNIQYWRTKTGHEVDFITEEGNVAIEVKISENPRKTDYKGLLTYCSDHKPRLAIVVCLVDEARKTSDDILILPWKKFLTDLWNGNIIK